MLASPRCMLASNSQVYTCLLLYLLGKPQESRVFHSLLFFPGELGSDRHPYSERLPPPSSLAHLGTSPRACQLSLWDGISHQHLAAPRWLSEEKHGLVLRQRSRGPCGPGCGLDLAAGFHSSSSQISSDLSSALDFPFSPAIVASLGQ